MLLLHIELSTNRLTDSAAFDGLDATAFSPHNLLPGSAPSRSSKIRTANACMKYSKCQSTACKCVNLGEAFKGRSVMNDISNLASQVQQHRMLKRRSVCAPSHFISVGRRRRFACACPQEARQKTLLSLSTSIVGVGLCEWSFSFVPRVQIPCTEYRFHRRQELRSDADGDGVSEVGLAPSRNETSERATLGRTGGRAEDGTNGHHDETKKRDSYLSFKSPPSSSPEVFSCQLECSYIPQIHRK